VSGEDAGEAIPDDRRGESRPRAVAIDSREYPAYEAYLKYRFYQWRFTPEDSQRSRECLEQALALDPVSRCRTSASPTIISRWRR
jgi:hypothetical protein